MQKGAKPRWLRYSLRSMLLVVLALSVWLGYMANQAAKQRRAIDALEELGGTVFCEYEIYSPDLRFPREPPGTAWLREILGMDWFCKVGGMSFGYGQEGVSLGPEGDPLNRITLTDQQLAGLIDDFPEITDLYIYHTTLGDSGLECLASLKRLRSLAINKNITDAGLRHLRNCSSLMALHAEGASITDTGLAEISQLRNLEYLDLRRTGVTDAGLAHLGALKNLQKIFLFDTNVTDQGVARLQGELPNLQIRF